MCCNISVIHECVPIHPPSNVRTTIWSVIHIYWCDYYIPLGAPARHGRFTNMHSTLEDTVAKTLSIGSNATV